MPPWSHKEASGNGANTGQCGDLGKRQSHGSPLLILVGKPISLVTSSGNHCSFSAKVFFMSWQQYHAPWPRFRDAIAEGANGFEPESTWDSFGPLSSISAREHAFLPEKPYSLGPWKLIFHNNCLLGLLLGSFFIILHFIWVLTPESTFQPHPRTVFPTRRKGVWMPSCLVNTLFCDISCWPPSSSRPASPCHACWGTHFPPWPRVEILDILIAHILPSVVAISRQCWFVLQQAFQSSQTIGPIPETRCLVLGDTTVRLIVPRTVVVASEIMVIWGPGLCLGPREKVWGWPIST